MPLDELGESFGVGQPLREQREPSSENANEKHGVDAILAPFLFWGGLHVAMADGIVSDRDRDRLQAVGPDGFGVADTDLLANLPAGWCIRHMQQELAAHKIKFSSIDRHRMLYGMLGIAGVAGLVEEPERIALHQIADLFGISQSACDLILQRYCASHDSQLDATDIA